jgi:hypothetical protein
MFKNLIKGVKNVLKSPIGQIGIGLLLPGAGTFLSGVKGAGTMANLARGIGSFMQTQPMLTQAGLGLLAGDKPQNVLRNVAYGSLARGIGAMGTPEGFMGGVKRGFGMTPEIPASMQATPVGGGSFSVEGGGTLPGIQTEELIYRAKEEPGFLERLGLVKSGENLGFFEKYSPLLKLGAVGATIAAAAMTPEQQKLFYDPTKNPYLPSGGREKAFYEDINPVYAATMNKGGVMDFPEKDGMINGPGNGQSDDIPAMLSDGEFVFTKQAVMAAGNGDREQGTKKMYEMMYSLEDKAENMGIGRI